MITITFNVDTDERGKIALSAQGLGVGNVRETEMAVAIYEAGRIAYQAVTLANGGEPHITESDKSRITPLGQG